MEYMESLVRQAARKVEN